MSHGHLSKVERGEHGRPVTPAVLHAYEKATGVKLTGLAGHGDPASQGWRRGHLSETRRRALNARIAAVAVGGQLGEQLRRILDNTGRIVVPDEVSRMHVVPVTAAAAWCTGLDLRYGGGLAAQICRSTLRWASGLLDTDVAEGQSEALYAAVGAVAQRAGWSCFDADYHETARSLLIVALWAATRADDPDLRAHVVADLAAQHNYLGFPDACLAVARFAEVDERVSPAVRMVIHGVKARAFAMQGETESCRQQVASAQTAQAATGDETGTGAATGAGAVGAGAGWRTSVASAGQLAASTGHALAALAQRTGDGPVRVEAVKTLGQAIDGLDPDRHTRAVAICHAQQAVLQIEAGELAAGEQQARHAHRLAAGIRSVRLDEHLARVRTVAGTHPELHQLAADLDPSHPGADR